MSQKQSFRYLISGGLLGLTTTMMFGASTGMLSSGVESAKPISLSSTTTDLNTNQTSNSNRVRHTTSSPTPTTTPEPSTSPTQSASGVTGSFDGSNEQVARYGYLQVKIQVEDGVLNGIDILDYPHRDRNSEYISQQVLPWLIEEAIKAQSADVAAISGATYTSLAFRSSLQAALNEAGL